MFLEIKKIIIYYKKQHNLLHSKQKILLLFFVLFIIGYQQTLENEEYDNILAIDRAGRQ